ncbi:hypothetical protein BCV70DRAFT_200563 [Testicularia cyperi]|uniref:Ion transport domain-containing protein n=1 Tax=Testicularia cyperi TaxID=1882483 RepID=A0A317XP56_9BASI|nr:hypothetical protein BCV70DRAFT_200563 [Testicularia cyperi]
MSSGTPHDERRLHTLQADYDVPPAIVSALIRRVKCLLIEFIDHDIDESKITSAEGIIDAHVIQAFHALGGDFGDAVPYALLETKKLFEDDAERQPLDHALNSRRAAAAEVVAIRLVAHLERASLEAEKQYGFSAHTGRRSHFLSLTKKFRSLQPDGDVNIATSALESAIDQNCVDFLSSIEARRATQAIWDGSLVQRYSPTGYPYFTPYEEKHHPAFLAHFHPVRLSVPKYSYIINIVLWCFFLAVFTVQTRTLKEFDVFEAILWIMAAGYIVEDASRWFKIRGLGAIEFWTVVDLCTDSLLVVSFAFRVASFATHSDKQQALYELRAFQFLACVAPLIWIQLLKIFDGFSYWGTVQVVILRMLRESVVFFSLLMLVLVGFGHAFLALDAADEKRVDGVVEKITDLLTQALLGGADFELTSEDFGYPFGKVLYSAYLFVSVVLLLNILIAFFGSAYSEVVETREQVYAAFFCRKVISMVRAPDQHVYLPPFNLLEAFIIAPMEWVVSTSTYTSLNYWVQSVLFSAPLMLIAWYESRLAQHDGSIALLLNDNADDDPLRNHGLQGSAQDPILPDSDSNDLQISTTKFDELVKMVRSS